MPNTRGHTRQAITPSLVQGSRKQERVSRTEFRLRRAFRQELPSDRDPKIPEPRHPGGTADSSVGCPSWALLLLSNATAAYRSPPLSSDFIDPQFLPFVRGGQVG